MAFKARGTFVSHLFGDETSQIYSVALHPTKLSPQRDFWEQPVTSISQEYVKTITGGGTQPVWIGLVSSHNKWRWVDNTSLNTKM